MVKDRERELHAREVFRRKLEEFLALDPNSSGSLTLHFQNGRIRRTELRTTDSIEMEQAS